MQVNSTVPWAILTRDDLAVAMEPIPGVGTAQASARPVSTSTTIGDEDGLLALRRVGADIRMIGENFM